MIAIPVTSTHFPAKEFIFITAADILQESYVCMNICFIITIYVKYDVIYLFPIYRTPYQDTGTRVVVIADSIHPSQHTTTYLFYLFFLLPSLVL